MVDKTAGRMGRMDALAEQFTAGAPSGERGPRWTNQMKRKLSLFLASVTMLTGSLLVGTLPASADPAPGPVNVQGRVGSWWCVNGGSVVYNGIAFVPGTNVTAPTGQNGDYTGWRKVPRNQQITVAGRALCRKPWYQGGTSYWVNVIAYRWYNNSTPDWYIGWI